MAPRGARAKAAEAAEVERNHSAGDTAATDSSPVIQDACADEETAVGGGTRREKDKQTESSVSEQVHDETKAKSKVGAQAIMDFGSWEVREESMNSNMSERGV